MQQKRTLLVGAIAVLAVAGLLWGCGDDKSTTPSTSFDVSLTAFDEMIESYAPPVYDGAVGVASLTASAPGDTTLGCWTSGNGALLRYGFGSQEPVGLHRNANRLGETIQWMNQIRALGDTTLTGDAGTMTVTALRQRIGIPEACQGVLGQDSLPLQYHVRVQLAEQTQTKLEAAFRQDDTCDLMLCYRGFASPDSAHPNAYEHSLTYAYRHHVRDTFAVRAVHVREYRNAEQECSMWTYEIASRTQNEFAYRLTWFAEDFADSAGLGSMIGAGNRQSQFALRYQQRIPPERPEPDTLDPRGHVYRLFGPNYVDQGITLGTSWDNATDPSHMYQYQHLPMGLRYALAGAEQGLNPWFEQ